MIDPIPRWDTLYQELWEMTSGGKMAAMNVEYTYSEDNPTDRPDEASIELVGNGFLYSDKCFYCHGCHEAFGRRADFMDDRQVDSRIWEVSPFLRYLAQ